ncbi:MAG TPA: hypothetical protein VFN42_07445 [Acetobacteraceae bacterium]|nr:hypothetical protein [Acetobacteraceae bacterium]
MTLTRMLQTCRNWLSRRGEKRRAAERATAEQRDLQRKQMLMTQLSGMLESGRRNGSKPR